MGRLAGFKYREVAKRLRWFGFEEFRHHGTSHVIWYNQETKQKTVLPKHRGDVPEGTLRAVLRQADIESDDFLKKK